MTDLGAFIIAIALLACAAIIAGPDSLTAALEWVRSQS